MNSSHRSDGGVFVKKMKNHDERSTKSGGDSGLQQPSLIEQPVAKTKQQVRNSNTIGIFNVLEDYFWTFFPFHF